MNRVSLGVQSFDEATLRRCGRSHGVAEVAAATALMRTHAPSWSLDLISSLPHQTLEGWRADLDAAVAAKPNHVSIYDLQVLCSHQPHFASSQPSLRDTLRPGNKRGPVISVGVSQGDKSSKPPKFGLVRVKRHKATRVSSVLNEKPGYEGALVTYDLWR